MVFVMFTLPIRPTQNQSIVNSCVEAKTISITYKREITYLLSRIFDASLLIILSLES